MLLPVGLRFSADHGVRRDLQGPIDVPGHPGGDIGPREGGQALVVESPYLGVRSRADERDEVRVGLRRLRQFGRLDPGLASRFLRGGGGARPAGPAGRERTHRDRSAQARLAGPDGVLLY